jgi:DNA-binding NtrC family response regulator
MKPRVLVVDDESSMREFLSIALGRMGHDVTAAESGEAALEMLEDSTFDVVLTDIRMPDGISGVELLTRIREMDPSVQVLLMTAYASVDSAVKAVQLGAADYIMKPFKVDQIKVRLDRAIEQRRLVSENLYMRKTIKEKTGPSGILGESSQIAEIQSMIEKLAETTSTVLITGESGTGKELVARAIHDASARSDGPFVTINCGALPEGLLESELFGHVKGSFTGAVKDKEGLFLVADGGTLFLDEVSETSLAIQVKLLRALQEREIDPVGGTQPIQVDVRLLAATNASLEERVANGTFREDLFYRLNVVPLHISPLRERKEDVPILAKHFLSVYSREERTLSEQAMAMLMTHDWPGNVRELENAIERAVIMTNRKQIGVSALPDGMGERASERLGALPEQGTPPTLETVEKAYISWVLTQAGGVKTAAADILGIDPSTLHRKMDKYDLREEKGGAEADA